ncbi:MAG TPA: F0F1 ATP synthase subunit B [Roseiflexaceae bacterium]|nr:F0F1 ATP synthase subunit B [Roseiflexaceae bacterium]
MEKLGINWVLLIAQLVNVVLLVWLLKRFLYAPVLNMLNERTKRIQDSLSEADKVRAQMADAQRDNEAELVRARHEAAAIVSQAQERARAQEQEIIAQARQEADRIRADAREQALRERDQMIGDLKNQVATLVTQTATRVLGAELQSNHDKLIEESLANLGRQN